MKRVRALVAEPHELVGSGLRVVFAQQAWIDRCLVATDAEQTIELARRWDPHVALVGAEVGGLGGIELSRRLVTLGGGIRTIMLSRHGELDQATVRSAGKRGLRWLGLAGAADRRRRSPRRRHRTDAVGASDEHFDAFAPAERGTAADRRRAPRIPR